jgi:flavin reductase (DIM6/NTAB) family NADH-FMN oxidoreductase RutF
MDRDYLAEAQNALTKIKEGAFLTVAAGDAVNTMTIGWAAIGYMWRNPILTVAVRDSRFTFTLIEKADDFTVTVPGNDYRKEIMFCGTRSGRDVNKFDACHLSTAQSRHVKSPIIDVAGLHFECRLVFKGAMDPAQLVDDYQHLYPERDYHTLYYGEIKACYET